MRVGRLKSDGLKIAQNIPDLVTVVGQPKQRSSILFYSCNLWLFVKACKLAYINHINMLSAALSVRLSVTIVIST